MEKKIFCLIEGRCKCLKYVVDENTTDYKSVMKKLMEVIKKDASLKTIILGKSIILQKKDPDRNNQLRDIDEDNAIPDKSDVHVLLMPVASTFEQMNLSSAPIIFSGVESDAFNVNVNLSTFEKSTADLLLVIDDSNSLPSTNNQGIVKTQLSVWIRNHRAGIKRTSETSQKRDHEGNYKAPSSRAVFVENNTDIENSLKELSKSYKEGVNIVHIKKLLKITLISRRPWIENQADRIFDVITKYPCLNHYELMLYEFLILREITFEVIVEKIDTCIDKLTNFCMLSETNNKTLDIINYLHKELSYKRVKQGMKDMVVIKQAMKSTEDLETMEGEAPRCVVYTLDQEIMSAYIVADACVQMEIPNADIHKILAGVLASYYVWHRNFPSNHRNMLQYLDHAIFDAPDQKFSVVVTKFIRKLNH